MIGSSCLALCFLFSSHSVLGSFLKQAWQVPNDYIPVEEIRKNCARGTLNEVTILLDLKQIGTLCTVDNNQNDNVDLIIPALQRNIASCYSDPSCTHLVWSRRPFTFNCPNEEAEARAREIFNLTMKTTCDVTADLKYLDIINNTLTISYPRLCPGGIPPKINHIFAMNPCPMPMRSQRIKAVSTEIQDSLYRIANELDQCGTSCQPIDLKGYMLQKLSCDGKTEVPDRGLGLYYTCNPNSTYVTPSTTAKTSLSTLDSGTSQQQYKEGSYLNALIVMSVLFALCLVLLVAVLVFFLCCRGRSTNISLPADDGPPSRQALYSFAKDEEQDGRPLSEQSANRYAKEPGRKTEVAEEYAIPMNEENDYENTENNYEAVDYMLPDKGKTRTLENSVTSKGNNYVSMKGQHKPKRDNTIIYSPDGYILPSKLNDMPKK